MTSGIESQTVTATKGSTKSSSPMMSIQVRPRADRRDVSTSMRTCSLFSIVYPAASRKTAAKRYHWISSSALELLLKILRTAALPALISTDASTSQKVRRARPAIEFIDEPGQWQQQIQGTTPQLHD